jgi:serine-type D-Ala-D-Ala carboxypeptidase
MRQRIYFSPLGDKGKYVYSDLGPILMKEIIENITGKPFDKFINDNFYKPLKLTNTAFNPLDKYQRKRIVPTENDTIFRRQLIHGYVHDPAAAMFGGVSGNAGVFSDANGLAIIMQMLINKGSYGGQNFFKASTVELFTKQQFPKNRRGLLFDKPETDTSKQSPCSKSASPMTFGHQGFTGTCAWADPEYGLIYIFLSNRIHPDVSNDKLVKMNVRTRIQEIIYKSIIDHPAVAN